jgi:hypothetical protein
LTTRRLITEAQRRQGQVRALTHSTFR